MTTTDVYVRDPASIDADSSHCRLANTTAHTEGVSDGINLGAPGPYCDRKEGWAVSLTWHDHEDAVRKDEGLHGREA